MGPTPPQGRLRAQAVSREGAGDRRGGRLLHRRQRPTRGRRPAEGWGPSKDHREWAASTCRGADGGKWHCNRVSRFLQKLKILDRWW
jgi:hypothetical protein